MNLFRWADPEWAVAFLHGKIREPFNLSNSYEFALEYGSVVCEFETVGELSTRKEDVRERKEDVEGYDSELMESRTVDGMEWDIWKGLVHYRLKPEKLKLVRIHFQAPVAECFGEMVTTNRKYSGLTQREFAEKTQATQPKISEYESFRREPEIQSVKKFGAFLPVEQVLHTEGVTVTL